MSNLEEPDIFRDPLIDREDVYYRAAILLQDIEEWHKDNPEFRGAQDEIPEFMKLSPEEAEQEIPLDLVVLEKQLEEYLEIVAAHPDYKELIVSWMVEIEGADGLSDERMNIDHEDNKVLDQKYHKEVDEAFSSLGGLYQAVNSYLERENYVIVQKAAGTDGWLLRMLCNDEAAQDLCDALHERFKKAIGRGLLWVKKKFWGYRLTGLSPANYKDFLDEENYEEPFYFEDYFAEEEIYPENTEDFETGHEEDGERFLDFGEFN